MVYCYEIEDGHSHEGLNETRVKNNDRLLLEEGDGVLEFRGRVQEVVLVKVDDERITNLERLLNEKLQNDFATQKTKPGMILNHSEDIPNCSVPNVTFNDTAVKQGLGGSSNDLMLPCSREFDMDNGEVACDGMSIDKADGKNDIPNGFVLDFTCNYIVVNQGLGGLSNDPMFDMDNGKVGCDGKGYKNANGKNEYTYSQRNPCTLDILIQAFYYLKDHPEIDVLQYDNDVDRSVPNLNHRPTTEPLHVDDFADDYMDVLNDEETVPSYSLDDMMLQYEENKFIVKQAPVKHQPVDQFIDVQEDKTTVLQENLKCIFVNCSELGTSLDPPWSDLELHLSGDEFLRPRIPGVGIKGCRIVTKEGCRVNKES
ncbi:hypothetical protein Tco_1524529 [Tanacetum coccineum]